MIARPLAFIGTALLLGTLATPSHAASTTAQGTNTTAVTSPAPQKQAARDVIQNFYTQLTDVMKAGDKLGFAGRYKKLDPAIRASFNLPLMTRFAVGSVWSSASAQEQQQLIEAFSDFSVATYANRFARYDGERFEVISEKPTTGGVMVETKLTPKGSDPVTLNYLMKADDQGSYRIVDVFLDGTISELATRRSEFGAIATREGIAALVDTLSKKAKSQNAG